MITKCTIRAVTNGYSMAVEFASHEKYEFVETSMEGILLLLYKLQAGIRENAKQPTKKGSKK